MINYFDKHIINFVDEWGGKIIPQLDKTQYIDVTKIYSKTKKSKMVLDSIRKGKRIYAIGFKNCRGMIRKWLYDSNGRMMREKGRGVVEINPSVITMSTIDINIPFVSSDEILLVKNHRDKPYNLEKSIVKEAMVKEGLNSKKDIQFLFFEKPSNIKNTINRFLDEFKHLITKEYCRVKGIMAIKDPKWKKYHASDEVTKYTDAFFFKGVNLEYTKRETIKKKLKFFSNH